MANSKAARKRIRQNETRRVKNRLLSGAMRTAMKKAREAIDGGAKNAPELVRLAVGRIDKAVQRGNLKKQTGSRLVSRLMSRKAA